MCHGHPQEVGTELAQRKTCQNSRMNIPRRLATEIKRSRKEVDSQIGSCLGEKNEIS